MRRYIDNKQMYRKICGDQLIGQTGGKTVRIVDFLNRTSIKKIISGLSDVLRNTAVCDTMLGEGAIGKVKVSGIGDTYTVTYKNLDVTLPCVIKESHIDGELSFLAKAETCTSIPRATLLQKRSSCTISVN